MHVAAFNDCLSSDCFALLVILYSGSFTLFAGTTAYPYIRDLMLMQSLPPPHAELFEGGRTPLNLAM